MNTKKLLKKYKDGKNTIISFTKSLFIFGIPVISIIYFGENRLYDIVHKNTYNNIGDWHNIIIIFLTLIIVCAGWLQFQNLNRTSKSDFLLRIDERFSSPEILKARTIIHEFYCLTNHKDIDINKHIEKISKLVSNTKKRAGDSEKYIYLSNFLNFLESISYFANNNYVSIDDLDELLGGSIKYYYLVYKLLINERREKYNSEYYYCEIQELAIKLHMRNPSHKPFIDTQ
ncbi:hypothetical protein Lrub_1486 [Legionella rubrilucens]|uniref:DUF4760 domain-containing protein n=1 Tax=Legionella rubrilucens TaxID=458 RepID=A0A0W0XUA0_9GAMM|nr:DUF4760 domain-containing protein [Legionella rubrilucens]KTD48122.1 hypothetical protein Lrub_1486 [Legionella rubrilucens]